MDNTSTISCHEGLQQLLDAGRSLIYVQTFEEDRLERLLTATASSRGHALWIWTANGGLEHGDARIEDSETAENALAHLLGLEDAPLVWLKDLHHHYRSRVLRALRDLYYLWRERGGIAVLSGPGREIPEDLKREMAFLVLDMPSRRELEAEIAARAAELDLHLPETPEVMSAALKGMTLSETRHALTRLKRQDAAEGTDALRVLQEEKRRLIAEIGTLEYIPRVPELAELGGLDNLKEWLLERRELIISTREEDREIVPKGVLLMGVSGCGKSLCIKAISSAWKLPLYRIEMVRIFSGAYGSPEIAFARACRMMEDLAPAVLWIDEIEMGLSAEGSSAADSVLSRIFAFFLTWMQEKPPGLFVAATANRIDLLPAEMIRKGRFDQVFFVDLPNQEEREQIFEIHLRKRGFDPKAFTPEVFADATEGWSGAEIEQCVIAAATAARMERRDLELKDLYASRKQIVPISQTMEEQVRHIRNWAYERAIRATAEA